MDQRRVSGLGEARKPLLVPRIEPMLSVVGSEKDVEIRVVGRPQWQSHDQQWGVNRQRHEYYDRKRNFAPKETRFRDQR
jgi:hypothetical protein